MSRTIPYGEPTSARAGETWEWKKTLSDYPSDTWTLSYALHNAASLIEITAAADGTGYLVDVAAATTGAYTAGRYDYVAQVTDGTDVYTVGTGSIDVLAKITAAADGRSHARIMLEAIQATLQGSATASQLDIVSGSHNGRAVTNDRGLLLTMESRYSAMVAAEEDAQRVAQGLRSSRLVQTRFRG